MGVADAQMDKPYAARCGRGHERLLLDVLMRQPDAGNVAFASLFISPLAPNRC